MQIHCEKFFANLFFKKVVGLDGDRTRDLLVANEALYQLSYKPVEIIRRHRGTTFRRPASALVYSFEVPLAFFKCKWIEEIFSDPECKYC